MFKMIGTWVHGPGVDHMSADPVETFLPIWKA